MCRRCGRRACSLHFVVRDDVAAAAAGILVGEGHHGAIYQATDLAAASDKLGEEKVCAYSWHHALTHAKLSMGDREEKVVLSIPPA